MLCERQETALVSFGCWRHAIVLYPRCACIEPFQKSGFHAPEKLYFSLFCSMSRATHFSPRTFSPWQTGMPRFNEPRLSANSRAIIVCSSIGEQAQPSTSRGERERLNQQHGERGGPFQEMFSASREDHSPVFCGHAFRCTIIDLH